MESVTLPPGSFWRLLSPHATEMAPTQPSDFRPKHLAPKLAYVVPQAGSDGSGRAFTQRKGSRATLPLHPTFLSSKPQHQSRVDTAVVVGGGPAGLSAAIEMAQRGITVAIVEKRAPIQPDGTVDYTRPVHLNVRPHFLDHLKSLGVYEPVMQRSGYTQSITRTGVDGKTVVGMPMAEPADASDLDAGGDAMVASPSVAHICIADLEEVMMARALSLGVTVIQNSTVSLVPSDPADKTSRHRVVLVPDEKHGPIEDLGIPDLVVVADGANSPTRKALAIPYEAADFSATFVSGSLEFDLGPRVFLKADADRSGEIIRRAAVGHAQNGLSWVLTQVPSNVTLAGPGETEAYYREQAAQAVPEALSEGLASAPLVWGGTRTFQVTQGRATKVTASDNIVLYGDACRSGHFLASLGVNTALVSDHYNLTSLLDGLNHHGHQRSSSLRAYSRATQEATETWLDAGAKDFVRYVAENGDAPVSADISDADIVAVAGPALRASA